MTASQKCLDVLLHSVDEADCEIEADEMFIELMGYLKSLGKIESIDLDLSFISMSKSMSHQVHMYMRSALCKNLRIELWRVREGESFHCAKEIAFGLRAFSGRIEIEAKADQEDFICELCKAASDNLYADVLLEFGHRQISVKSVFEICNAIRSKRYGQSLEISLPFARIKEVEMDYLSDAILLDSILFDSMHYRCSDDVLSRHRKLKLNFNHNARMGLREHEWPFRSFVEAVEAGIIEHLVCDFSNCSISDFDIGILCDALCSKNASDNLTIIINDTAHPLGAYSVNAIFKMLGSKDLISGLDIDFGESFYKISHDILCENIYKHLAPNKDVAIRSRGKVMRSLRGGWVPESATIPEYG